jgi:pyridoxamine 5'-phosphate oxidase
MTDRPLLDVAALREEYFSVPLAESEAATDPVAQFRDWLDAAIAEGLPEPTAMVLSTADEQGQPSARTVLLKGVDERGFAFFTNRTSRKGRELAVNPAGALVFPWIAMRRQVVVRGPVAPVDDAESDDYFASRPRGSQLAAWASQQSAVLPDRASLEQALAAVAERFDGAAVPRPPHWGGYRLEPTAVEFWQGRPDRLHDRLRYVRTETAWRLERLWP